MPGRIHRRRRPTILLFIHSKGPARLLALPLYAARLIRRLDKGVLAVLAFAALLAALLAQTAIYVLAPNARALIGKVVVIDPGHGGIDPGTHDKEGTTEKEIVLDIARRTFSLLGKAKAVPIQTRHGDWSLDELYPHESTRHRQDLAARIHIADRIKADAMVCVHVNKSPHASARGPVTFYSQTSQDSRRLAWCIQKRLAELQPKGAGGILKGDFYILRNSKVPTVIAEVGFLSNPEEKKLLLTPSYRQDVAEAIFTGLADFFEGQGVSPAITRDIAVIQDTAVTGDARVTGGTQVTREAPATRKAPIIRKAPVTGDTPITRKAPVIRDIPAIRNAPTFTQFQ